MGFFIKTLAILALIFAIFRGLGYGYDSVIRQISTVMEQTYGALGDQLNSADSCDDAVLCTSLNEAGRDLQNINIRAQQVLGTSSEN